MFQIQKVSELVSELVTRSPIELFWTAKNNQPCGGYKNKIATKKNRHFAPIFLLYITFLHGCKTAKTVTFLLLLLLIISVNSNINV